jgi:uncharacterized protein with HEPN domain
MDKRDRIILEKILSETGILSSSLAGFDKDSFMADEVMNRAACMTLINIGELVKHLTMEFRQSHASIPWKNIAGLRDIAAHGYFTLRMDDIWQYASDDIPMISKQIGAILLEEKAH